MFHFLYLRQRTKRKLIRKSKIPASLSATESPFHGLNQLLVENTQLFVPTRQSYQTRSLARVVRHLPFSGLRCIVSSSLNSPSEACNRAYREYLNGREQTGSERIKFVADEKFCQIAQTTFLPRRTSQTKVYGDCARIRKKMCHTYLYSWPCGHRKVDR